MALLTALSLRKLQAVNWCRGYAWTGAVRHGLASKQVVVPRESGVSSTLSFSVQSQAAVEYWVAR